MKKSPLAVAFVLALATSARGAPIEEVHFANVPTGGIVTFGWDDEQSVLREALIRDALDEWDEVVCTERYFIWDYFAGTIKIKWEDLGADGTLARATANSITINSNSSIKWYEGFGTPGDDEFDLLTILKHEIGHAIGVVGDWGRVDPSGVGEEFDDANGNGVRDPEERYYDTNFNGRYDDDYVPPDYASSDQLMWGFLSPKQTIRNIQYCDARELQPAYTIHIPEPATHSVAWCAAVPLLLKRRHT